LLTRVTPSPRRPARRGSPHVQQRRVHPAMADGHRSLLGTPGPPAFLLVTERSASKLFRTFRTASHSSHRHTVTTCFTLSALSISNGPRNPARALSEYRHHGAHRCR